MFTSCLPNCEVHTWLHTQEISRNTSYLLGNVDAGTQEFLGMGNHMDDGQTTRTDESQMMMSCQSCTSQSHK